MTIVYNYGMNKKLEGSRKIKVLRDDKGRIIPGQESINPDGRPKDTPEKKIVKKAIKQLIAEYKEGLAEALPKIKPVLIAKAMEGDVPAIRELHDRVMDKAKQATDVNTKIDATIKHQMTPEKKEELLKLIK
jgi:hypothetical protein